VYVSVLGATVLTGVTSAFAENGRNGIFSNAGQTNQQNQPNQYYQYYQNFFPQQNQWRHNNDRDVNNEQYIDREDANVNLDIGRDGSVLIRSAVVNGISGNNITLTSTLGNANLTWTLLIDNNTKLESRNGRRIDRREINVGDKVTVKGKLMSGSSLSVRADLIRNTWRTVRR
jgi:hypothetical protein